MRILEPCVILKKERRKKKKGEENPRRGGIIRQKWHRLFQKRGPRVQPRFRGRAETFPGNLSTRVENESAAVYSRARFPSPPPRNFFNIRIRVGPPTRAQSLPRRRRLSLFRVRERNFAFRGRAKQNPIGSIFHSRSQEDQSPDNFSTVWLIPSHWIHVERFFTRFLDSNSSISLSLYLSEAVS